MTDRTDSAVQSGDDVRRRVLRSPAGFLALGFGAGLTPVAPGTAGTVMAVPLALGIQQLQFWPALGVVGLMFLVGIPVCQMAAMALRTPDPEVIVWDEIVGFCLAAVLSPSGWPWLFATFVLFRAFDIAKPWPIGWLEKVGPGGLGIMADDIAAALYSAAVLRLASWGVCEFAQLHCALSKSF